jgi:lysophospholipase L1-like esterase
MKKLSTIMICAVTLAVSAFAEDAKLPLTIEKKAYKAELGSKGLLSSITVNGKEFLSKEKGLPGGFYLCAGGVPPVKLQKLDANTFEGENAIAKINYKFNAKKIVVTVSDIKKKGSLYILINKAVEKVNYLKGSKDVPTIAALPVKARCDNTRWIQSGASLDINGGVSIWGPWKNHQVWEAKLVPGKTVTIEIAPGDEDTEQKTTAKAAEKKTLDLKFTYEKTTEPQQIPLCMIGDSITWAGKGDYWRKYLLVNLPRLAFVGTHSAVLGYSHAGEGGNSTGKVLNRINDIPDCPYYSLLIGTNDTGVKDESKSQPRAERTAERIQKIVFELLKKNGVKKVFLCSILPCYTKNPLRDKTNSLTNKILRKKMKDGVFPAEKVIWIEFEEPIRAIEGWEPLIKLHPTPEGYKKIAKIHADKIAEALEVKDPSKKPKANPNTGVRICNLWDTKTGMTKTPVIAGWHTVSFKLDKITGDAPAIRIISAEEVKKPFDKSFKLSAPQEGKRSEVNFFTNYEGYGYTRSNLKIEPIDCEISQILFEKTRPSMKASQYGDGIYIDAKTPSSPGELIENKGK